MNGIATQSLDGEKDSAALLEGRELEQRVDKRCHRCTPKHDDGAKQNKEKHDRRQPPLFVVTEPIDVFAQQASRMALRQLNKLIT
jgi:hypothetical protein